MSIPAESELSLAADHISGVIDEADSRLTRSERVIVFARFPEAGQAKTRLIPALGSECAAQLQAALTRRILDVVRQLCSVRSCDVEVRFAGGDAAKMRQLIGAVDRYSAQHGTDLGERMEHAVATAFAEKAHRVVVIGTDCPEIDAALLETAFEALLQVDVVLGPALDGGYYLLGMRAHQPAIFRGIDWSTENVLRQTMTNAHQAKCVTRRLRPLSDIDFPEDLLACRRVAKSFAEILPGPSSGLLSIVVPTLNEERILEQSLRPLVDLNEVEVIVADGGSADATVDIARRMGVRVVSTRSGRGQQMNAGAAVARGEALLFLHADATLPDGFVGHVWSTFDRGAIAGAFPLHIDHEHSGLRWIEWGANLRSRYLQMPYGDQGLFVRSELFYRIGGFPNWPLMEDYELCRRLRKHGRILLAPSAISTSARRWLKLGLWRTTIINQLCITGFRLGVSPARLARWYSASWRRRR